LTSSRLPVRPFGTIRPGGGAGAGHDRHSFQAFQREKAPDFTTGHAPGADDLGNAVHAKADDGAGIHAGDLRRFPRHELVDHLGGAHLGHCDRQLAQGLLLVEELADAFLGARSIASGEFGPGCLTAHHGLLRLTGRRGGGVPRRPCSSD
jgi:hypothetical protein